MAFATVTHPDMTDVIRIVLDGADYVIDGNVYTRSSFEINMISDTDQPPVAQFRFPNVDRAAITMLQSVSRPARVAFDLVSSRYFDLTVEPRVLKPATTIEYLYRARSLFLVEIKADSMAVEGTLRGWDWRQEIWTSRRVTQAMLPGCYV